VLGFWARDQHFRRDLKFKAPEFLLAGEVLRGLAEGTAPEKREVFLCRFGWKDFLRMSIEPGAIATGDVKQEQLRSQREGRNFRGAKLLDTLPE
jgi:hypothetical protein